MMQFETMRQDEMTQWRGEPLEADTNEGVRRYADAARHHWRVVVVMLVIAIGAAALYLAAAPKVYNAQADLLITPAPSDDATALFTPGIVRASSDPVQAAETTATLATSSSVAAQARAMLHGAASATSAVATAQAAPVGESNVVAITAQSDDPNVARAAANAVARATVDVHTREVHAQLDHAIAVLSAQVAADKSPSTGAGSLPDTLARLQALRSGQDPTISVGSLAPVPTRPSSPRRTVTLLAAVLIGLVLGLGGALLRQSRDPRLRREEDLRNVYGAPPVLARIPVKRLGRSASRDASDPYRTLVASLAGRLVNQTGPRTVVVTGSSRGDGATTTAMRLGRSIAAGGNRVIVVVTDPTFEMSASRGHGLWSVLVGAVSVTDALVPARGADHNLRLLLASDAHAGEWEHEGISHAAARELLDALKGEADWVIIDAPPLSGMVNALPFAQEADAVLLVARVGHSNTSDIAEALDIVRRHSLPLAGCALVGVPTAGRATERRARRVDDLEAILDGRTPAAR